VPAGDLPGSSLALLRFTSPQQLRQPRDVDCDPPRFVPREREAGTVWSATMTVPLLVLMILIVALGAEVGWLCRALA
jgi:hypothetical protein